MKTRIYVCKHLVDERTGKPVRFRVPDNREFRKKMKKVRRLARASAGRLMKALRKP